MQAYGKKLQQEIRLMKSKNQHTLEQIHKFVEGSLSEQEVDKLWAHLIANPGDLEYLQTLATLKKMGHEGAFLHNNEHTNRENQAIILPVSTRKIFGGYVRHYLAAAAILLLAMAVLYNVFSNNTPEQAFTPISMIEFDIERSADETVKLGSILNTAISKSTAGNISAALDLLESVDAETMGTDEAIDLYIVKGTILYNAGDYQNAHETFGQILKMNPGKMVMEKSYWYLANTQLQLGMKKEARENIINVIEADGSFSRVAQLALESL
jgi:tetratricopeptide (TPR) repeat protein